jgi:Flp pilus assembly pilin Flp
MKSTLIQLWREEDGVLSFEWTLLLTLLVIGIVGGVAGARDAIIDELGDVAQVMLAVDQSYTIAFPLQVNVHTSAASSASDTAFIDALLYEDCGSTFPGPPDQQPGPGIPIDDFNPAQDDFG